MRNRKVICRPVVIITPADVIGYCATRRQKPTTSEAQLWLERQRAEIEREICHAVRPILDNILDNVALIEYPDPRMNEKYRAVDGAIVEAINKYCEIIGKEDHCISWSGASMQEVLRHLLDYPHWNGMICMAYTVEYGEPYKGPEDQLIITHLTDRAHIFAESGKLFGELAIGAECHHDDSVFVAIEKER